MTGQGSDFDLSNKEREEKHEAMKALRDNLPIHNWDQINSNPYNSNIEFGMLVEGGLVTLKHIKLKSDKRKGQEKYPGKVRHDKSYVIAYITAKILKTLDPSGKYRDFIEKLLKEVLDTYYGDSARERAAKKQKRSSTERFVRELVLTPKSFGQSGINTTLKRISEKLLGKPI